MTQLEGRYSLGEEVGRGGVGRVVRAHDRDLDRTVALKQLHERSRTSADAVRRFVEEAQIGAQLQHPGIVQVYSIGMHDGAPFFTMRIVEGRTFSEILQHDGKEVDLRRNLETFLAVCHATGYAHARGLVHRDLKPSNVLVGAFGEVQVVDWGMAKLLDADATRSATISPIDLGDHDRSVAGSVFGTPAYMPPEQALGEIARIDARADVFALGAMLAQVLTGAPAYEGESTVALESARRGDTEDVLARIRQSGAPPELARLAARCLSLRPDDRPADGVAVAKDVREYLDSCVRRSEQSREDAEREAARARASRVLFRWIAGFALLLLAGVAVVLVAWQRAKRSADQAHEALTKFDALAWVERLDAAESEAEELWPAWPNRRDAMQRWLEETAAPVLAAPNQLRVLLSALAESDLERERFLHDTIADLLKRIERFDSVTVDVQRRVDAADRVALRMKEHSDAWRRTIAAIASDADYGGLAITPQFDLTPLGKNPVSRLYEFLHLSSHTDETPPPERDPKTGRLRLDHRSGIVFVLIPAGSLRVADRLLEVEAFFIAKTELTQAQWLALGERNPSRINPSMSKNRVQRLHLLRRPVETLTVDDAQRALRRRGLTLPTELQWEYACRGGTTTPWYTGDDVLSLHGHANVLDQEYERVNQTKGEPFNDGWAFHTAVASCAPNPYGLFDMHGNVAEWCLSLETAVAVHRGGSCHQRAAAARCAIRTTKSRSRAHWSVGVRAVRQIH